MPALTFHGVYNENNYVRSPFYHHDRAFFAYQERQDYLHKSFLGLSDPPLNPSYDKNLTDRKIIDLTTNFKSNDSVLSYLRGASVSQPQFKFGGENITFQTPLSFWKELTQCASHVSLRIGNLFNRGQPCKIVTPKAPSTLNSDSFSAERRPSEIKDEAESTILFSTQAMVTQVILNYFQYKIIVKVVAVTNTELFNETPTVVNCL
jgi:hypothetical protein